MGDLSIPGFTRPGVFPQSAQFSIHFAIPSLRAQRGREAHSVGLLALDRSLAVGIGERFSSTLMPWQANTPICWVRVIPKLESAATSKDEA